MQVAAIFLFLAMNVNSQTVTPWFTSADKSKLLEQQPAVSFGPNVSAASVNLTLDPATTYQTMDGFGFAMTEGSAEVISSLSSTVQSTLLNELFNKSTGLGISVLRISIGASDLSSSDYSYDETAGDVTMANFSITGSDLTYLIPILKKALAINPNIKILATPWSAPRWMKTNTTTWIGGSLKPTYFAAYASYFVKYLDAMKAQGISIWAITPQNEPENSSAEPSMLMTSTDQKTFINSNLGPAMATAGYSGVKIIAYDHNCNDTAYPIDVLNNSTYVDGAAFHLYSGNISALTTVSNATGKNVYFTEQFTASTGSFSGDLAWHMQNIIIGAGNNSAKAIIEWNVASNAALGPHTTGGCSTCQGAATITSNTYTKNLSYYLIGHISKFVSAGAVRIKSTSSSSNVVATAYQNPVGSLVVLTYNGNSSSQTVKIVWNTLTFVSTVPGSSAATFTWNPTTNAISDVHMNEITLSPNPGQNEVSLKLPENGVNYSSVRFISLDGKTALHQSIPTGSIEKRIDVTSLANGIYVVRIDGANNPLYGRFIKQ